VPIGWKRTVARTYPVAAMSRIADFRRWVARNPGTVDRAMIAAGFVLGVFAVVNGARNDDLALNLLLALLGGVAVAALITWSRRRQRVREEGARRVVIDERLRIARELHDVVAHHVSVMGVQAAGARRILDKDPAQAATALEAIESTSREAVTELQRLLGMLRSTADDGSIEGRPGVGQLAALATSSRDSGLPVELLVEGSPPDRLPATLDLSIYRIVQEALTNARKHGGPGTHAEVRVRFTQRTVEVVVSDDGAGTGATATPAPSGGSGGGRGIAGMRERVGLFGGELTAGPRAEGGFVVRAVLPTGGA